jgi:hypothetical protein
MGSCQVSNGKEVKEEGADLIPLQIRYRFNISFIRRAFQGRSLAVGLRSSKWLPKDR